MLINLVEAFRQSDQVIIEETFHDFVFNYGVINIPVIEGVQCQVTLKRYANNEITIEGTSTAQLNVPCDRCTKEVTMDINTEFSRNIHLHDEDDSAYLNGINLDLIKFLNVEMIQVFPQKVLCKETCKGICPTCGQNLNEHECSCDRGHVDIRMAQIKDLFESKFKEV